MMKKAIFILFLILQTATVKAEPVFASCITEFPTTSYIIETDKDIVTARIIMHAGPNFGPFWQGVVVPNDLKILTEYATEFVKLNPDIEIKWKSNQCTWDDDNFYCSGKTDKVQSGVQTIDPWSLYSTRVIEKNFAGKYEYINLNFSFNMNGTNYNIPMKYSDYECRIRKAPLLNSKKN